VGFIAFYYLFNAKTTSKPPEVSKPSGKVTENPDKKPKKDSKEKKTSANKKQKSQPARKENDFKFDDDANTHSVVTQEEETAIFKQFQSKSSRVPDLDKILVAPKEKKEQTRMAPSQKQIEKDIERGFTIVSKKGPTPLTAEQKKEREEAKRREEEEAKRKKEETKAWLERQQKRKEQIVAKEMSQDDIKATLEKHKAEKNAKLQEKSKPRGGVVKTYLPAKTDEMQGPKSWAASVVSGTETGVDSRVEDNADYPRLPSEIAAAQLPVVPSPPIEVGA
jgi:hypothetical protein